MLQAYSYRVEHADNCYWVYLNQILLGTIEKGVDKTWYINITLTGDNLLFTKFGLLKPSIYIQDINSGEAVGNINIPLFPIFFRKFRFFYMGSKKLYWVGKNFLSFHWFWRMNDDTVVDTVEDILQGNNSGVITLASHQKESNLLILTGIFLSLRRKKKLSFGLLRQHRTG
jgi:hypothetical protein